MDSLTDAELTHFVNNFPFKADDYAVATSYPGDYAAFSIEDKAKWQNFYDNFKVVGVPHCSVHPHVDFCSCALSLGSMKPYNIYRTKVDGFIRKWDQYLLLPDYGAYDYDGTQESHQAFQAKNNQTPKHFARAFAQNVPRSSMFGPSGKLQDLVKALVEFWVMRTAMWKAKYSNAEEVEEKWLPATYDMSDKIEMSSDGVTDLLSAKSGDPHDVVEVKFGIPGHDSVVWLRHLDKLDKLTDGFAVKVARTELCHGNCPTMLEQLEHFLKLATQSMAMDYFDIEADLASIKYGPTAEMRAHFGLQPDSLANTVEKDVLWVV